MSNNDSKTNPELTKSDITRLEDMGAFEHSDDESFFESQQDDLQEDSQQEFDDSAEDVAEDFSSDQHFLDENTSEWREFNPAHDSTNIDESHLDEDQEHETSLVDHQPPTELDSGLQVEGNIDIRDLPDVPESNEEKTPEVFKNLIQSLDNHPFAKLGESPNTRWFNLELTFSPTQKRNQEIIRWFREYALLEADDEIKSSKSQSILRGIERGHVLIPRISQVKILRLQIRLKKLGVHFDIKRAGAALNDSLGDDSSADKTHSNSPGVVHQFELKQNFTPERPFSTGSSQLPPGFQMAEHFGTVVKTKNVRLASLGDSLPTDEIVSELFSEAASKGANALLNFRVSSSRMPEFKSHVQSDFAKPFYVEIFAQADLVTIQRMSSSKSTKLSQVTSEGNSSGVFGQDD